MMHENLKTSQNCLICDSSQLELLVDFGCLPLAGGFMAAHEIETRNKTYPLRLANCPNCKLMQLLDFVSSDEIFRQYSFASSTTQSLSSHFNSMGIELVSDFSAKGKLIVEIGCNDGVLIRSMLNAGARVVGVDPSDVAEKASQKSGWKLVNDYFSEETASRICGEFGKAKIVVGNNVFAHVDDIHSVMRGVNILLEDEGVLVIEVHYQGDLLKKGQFDMVYHEHIFYYSLTSLIYLFSLYDLRIIDVTSVPVHAGSIRVVAARKNSSYSVSFHVAEMLEQEVQFDPRRFAENTIRYRRQFHELVANLKDKGKSIGAYGASGRMTVLMNYCELGTDMIDYVVDMSPLRYDRIVPGVLLPIISPEEFRRNPPNYMIMTAWSYESEILTKEQDYLKNGGQFIIPLPTVRLVGDGFQRQISFED